MPERGKTVTPAKAEIVVNGIGTVWIAQKYTPFNAG